jgi:hypothetical protein
MTITIDDDNPIVVPFSYYGNDVNNVPAGLLISNAGINYVCTGAKRQNYKSTITTSTAGSGSYWTTEYRVPKGTTKIRFKVSNKTASQITVPAIFANTNTTNGGVSSVGNTVTENLDTGWSSIHTNGVLGIVCPENSSVFSEWQDIAPIPALDSGRSIVLLRLFLAGVGYITPSTSMPLPYRTYSNTANLAIAGTYQSSHSVGDGFETDAQISLVLAVGDSLTAGFPSGSWLTSIDPDKYLFENVAVLGHTSTQYLSVLKGKLENTKYSFVIYPPYTPNDPKTPSGRSTAKDNFIEAMKAIRDSGAIPITSVIVPNNSLGLVDDDYRKALLSETSGIMIGCNLDLISAVNTGGSPDRYASASYTTDGVHYTAEGRDLLIARHTLISGVIYDQQKALVPLI